ncbi:hypothetical protein Glove_266g27 [Diversispora epigaea]|uniref:Protein kinase domain-containing protein n=1 Tax=Diversispora epigaea TaxID=1348612 RepID=A0A397IBU2_9GLOM|nr:hypothetical protein Glove_266g27 [Diversispora epigaea]
MSSDKICQECNQEYTDNWGRWCRPCNSRCFKNDFDKWTSGNKAIDKFIQDAQINANNRFKDIKQVAKGGFGTIYSAQWIDGQIRGWKVDLQKWHRYGQNNVALKKFDNKFVNLNEAFLNEATIHLKASSKYASLLFYGITQDPETKEYIMVVDFMPASKFERIHKLGIIHHDFHPGNILSYDFKNSHYTSISDFGLTSEVLCEEEYTKAADVYSFGIIAYEMITGFAPYYDIPHDRDLAMQIFTHRSTFEELFKELGKYYENYKENDYKNNYEITIQIEDFEKLSKNLGSTNSTIETPMNYKTHPQAIYIRKLFGA